MKFLIDLATVVSVGDVRPRPLDGPKTLCTNMIIIVGYLVMKNMKK